MIPFPRTKWAFLLAVISVFLLVRPSIAEPPKASDDYMDTDDPFEMGNRSQASSASASNQRQTYMNPAMQAQVGLRTVMMSGMLYGLSLLPAVMVLLGGGGLGTLGGALASLGKRSIPDGDPGDGWMPFLPGKEKTARFLGMLHKAFQRWNVVEDQCRQLYVCQIYQQVAQSGMAPELDLFQQAIHTVFVSPGSRNRRDTTEKEARIYYEAARVGAEHGNCTSVFSSCPHTMRLTAEEAPEDQLLQPDDVTSKEGVSSKAP